MKPKNNNIDSNLSSTKVSLDNSEDACANNKCKEDISSRENLQKLNKEVENLTETVEGTILEEGTTIDRIEDTTNNLDTEIMTGLSTDSSKPKDEEKKKVLTLAEIKKKKIKKWILNIVFILFNLIALTVVLLMEQSTGGAVLTFKEIATVIFKFLPFFLLALLMYIITVACDAICYFGLIQETGYGKRIALSIKVTLLGRYYDNITPWATGGQPFQMAYLIRYGIDTPTACSLPVIKLGIRALAIDIVIFTILFVSTAKVPEVMAVAAIVGVLLNTLLPISLLIFAKRPAQIMRFTEWIMKIGVKLRLVKNYKKEVAKVKETVNGFLEAYKYLGTHKKMILLVGIFSAIEIIAVSSIPYFVIRSFGIANINYIDTLAMCLYVTFASSFFPAPGASGASEASFYAIFAETLQGGYIFWAVLFWRIFTFYMPLVMGVVIQILDWIVGKRPIEQVKEASWKLKTNVNNTLKKTKE